MEKEEKAKEITDRVFAALRESGYDISTNLSGKIYVGLDSERIALLRFRDVKDRKYPNTWTLSSTDDLYLERLGGLGELMERTARETSQKIGFSLDNWKGVHVLNKMGIHYSPKKQKKVTPEPVEEKVDKLNRRYTQSERSQNAAIRREQYKQIVRDSPSPLCAKEIRERVGLKATAFMHSDLYALVKKGEIMVVERRRVDNVLTNFYAIKGYKPQDNTTSSSTAAPKNEPNLNIEDQAKTMTERINALEDFLRAKGSASIREMRKYMERYSLADETIKSYADMLRVRGTVVMVGRGRYEYRL